MMNEAIINPKAATTRKPNKSGQQKPQADKLEASLTAPAATNIPPALRNAHILALGPSRFFNRELSWLAFNTRVLEEASNPHHPLLERLRFLSISANNLDEFFMVRVAGLKGQVQANVRTASQDGLYPSQQLEQVLAYAARLMEEQSTSFQKLKRDLAQAEYYIYTKYSEMPPDRNLQRWLKQWFMAQIFPTLTPLAVDPSHPFPFIPNSGLFMALQMKPPASEDAMLGLVPIPSILSRFIRLPNQDAVHFLLLDELIKHHLHLLFPGFMIEASGVFRVLRDSDVEIEEEAEDLVRTFESLLRRRRRGQVIRLTHDAKVMDKLKALVAEHMAVEPAHIFAYDGIVGMVDLAKAISDERPKLLFTPYSSRFPERIRDHNGDCFAAIRAKDIIIHHPYESFDVVVQFIRQAAQDPNVLTIKQTLYRTSANSPIVAALIEAAEQGKTVTALVELKARFDEEANIRWARDLERAGVQVVYGFVSLKTHAKLSMVVRREAGQLRTYVHFGTGNYHPITAKIYTDLSYFTCDAALARDAALAFNYITGYAKPKGFEEIALAPLTLRQRLLDDIAHEIDMVKHGHSGQIWIKVNNLVDEGMIDALYAASQAGVDIELVVRGICCLRPQVKGLSERIKVRSLIGRFLEHARIFAFGNGRELPSAVAKVYIASADLMNRNLNRRVETLIPIHNATAKRQVLEQIFYANLLDEAHSWLLAEDGQYHRHQPVGLGFNAQSFFMTNPSLSGRGTALHKKSGAMRPKPLTKLLNKVVNKNEKEII